VSSSARLKGFMPKLIPAYLQIRRPHASGGRRKCMCNLERLVKPEGYVFASGVDLGVRSKVARDLGSSPVAELITEIHEGNLLLRRDWPLECGGFERFDPRRIDCHSQSIHSVWVGGSPDLVRRMRERLASLDPKGVIYFVGGAVEFVARGAAHCGMVAAPGTATRRMGSASEVLSQ
jgi:hypothetical protein